MQVDADGRHRTINPEFNGVFESPPDAMGHLRTVIWWAHQDSNLEPRDYESPALTVEL